MDRHALVVGGTGMLRGVCLGLAASGWTVSVIARRHAPLAALARDAAEQTGQNAIHPIPLDYHDIPSLALGIRTAIVTHGPISLAACYIHSSAPMAPFVIADTLAARACQFIHIVGSAAPDELWVDSTRDEIAAHPLITYRRVILGFIRERDTSRWLTDEEICRGVLKAIDDPTPEQVIGTVSPWELHPPL